MGVISILFTILGVYYDDTATLAIKNATLCGRYYSLSLSMWRRRLSASRIYNIPPPGETLTTLAGCPQLFGPVSPRVASLPHFLGPERREIVCYCRDCRPWIGWNEFLNLNCSQNCFLLHNFCTQEPGPRNIISHQLEPCNAQWPYSAELVSSNYQLENYRD